MIAKPGNVAIHHASLMKSRPSASIAPHSGVGGCAPKPRKLRAAAHKMAVATEIEEYAITEPTV